jgi:hypothetical protein
MTLLVQAMPWLLRAAPSDLALLMPLLPAAE